MDLRKQRRLKIAGAFLMVAGAALLIAVLAIFVFPQIQEPKGSGASLAQEALASGALAPERTLELSHVSPPDQMVPGQTGDYELLPDSEAPGVVNGYDATASTDGPTRLVIPALDIDAAVLPVSLVTIDDGQKQHMEWQVPAEYAAGWHANSAPLGQAGNTVINGHNNVYGAIFRNLASLGPGHEIILYDHEKAYTYEVVQQEFLKESGQSLQTRVMNARWILPTSDERLTIVTCWPYTTNTHRLVVIALPVSTKG